jgi:hypothetical protein
MRPCHTCRHRAFDTLDAVANCNACAPAAGAPRWEAEPAPAPPAPPAPSALAAVLEDALADLDALAADMREAEGLPDYRAASRIETWGRILAAIKASLRRSRPAA